MTYSFNTIKHRHLAQKDDIYEDNKKCGKITYLVAVLLAEVVFQVEL